MPFTNLGDRNKGTFWEYLSAYSYLTTKLPDTAFQIPDFFGFGQGMPNKHCHTTEEIDLFCNKVFWEELKAGIYTSNFFKSVVNVYLKPSKVLKRMVKNQNFSSFSNEKLSHFCTQAVKYMSTTHKPMLQALYTMYLEKSFEKELKRTLTSNERQNPSYLQQTKALLLTMPKLSIANREEAAIMGVENLYWKKYKNASPNNLTDFFSNPTVNKLLQSITRDSGWFRMEYMHEPFSEEDYRKEISKRLQAGRIKKPSPTEAAKIIKQKQNEFFKKHRKSTFLKKIVNALHGFSFILDHSKEIVVYEHWLIIPLLNEIAKRLKVTRADLLFLVLPEITENLMTKEPADKNIVNQRKTARAVLLKDGIITWYTGNDALNLGAKLLPEPKSTSKKILEFKGIIAYPGKFRGKAVIIRSILDKNKFKKGDILVTHDGTAELNLFLQQAGAIVTNKGGMICHAAIVAREMKTPAIVGTNIATQVIKDGDLIEVDADRGIVRKI